MKITVPEAENYKQAFDHGETESWSPSQALMDEVNEVVGSVWAKPGGVVETGATTSKQDVKLVPVAVGPTSGEVAFKLAIFVGIGWFALSVFGGKK